MLLLKGGTYLETGKHDYIGKVQVSYNPVLAQQRGNGNGTAKTGESPNTRLTTAVETAWLAAG
jgi:hypothetical protein